MTTHRALALSLLALLAAPALARAHEPADDARSVFIVGDSHVEMLGPMLTRRLEGAGARVLGHESRRGWSTARYRAAGDLGRLLEERGRPELVIVCLGGNDRTSDPTEYAEELRWIVDQARGAGAEEIVWIGPASSDATAGETAAATGARHERNASWQSELVPALGVRWIDSRPVTLEHHGRDGVHFTRRGYAAWTDGVLALLPQALPAVVAGEDASA